MLGMPRGGHRIIDPRRLLFTLIEQCKKQSEGMRVVKLAREFKIYLTLKIHFSKGVFARTGRAILEHNFEIDRLWNSDTIILEGL